ncbi:MAG TPA: NAD(P)-dependent oxidoreductase [Candidatus Pelagibacter sp.]|nr:NAD(P)-dependent oxidoreductase [Candidatus Pelagibacter sp.]
MNLKKNILIVGGTGFIGYHLAKRSLQKGWKVTSISTKLPKKIRYLKKVKYIICDITKKKLLKKKIKISFDYVVNLGGYVNHQDKKKTFKSHYHGCKNLAEFFLKKNLIAFIQMGSSVEYGNVKSPQKESVKCNIKLNKSTYGKAKLLSSIYLQDLYKKKKFPSTILRLYLAYGPKQDVNRLIPIIIKGCLKNKKFSCSSGTQLRDFIHVDDVVNAIFKLFKSKNARGQIINIGSGKPKKIKTIIETIRRISKGGYPQYGKIQFREDEISELYPSIKKIKTIIDWKPNISFAKGLKSTIESYNGKSI